MFVLVVPNQILSWFVLAVFVLVPYKSSPSRLSCVLFVYFSRRIMIQHYCSDRSLSWTPSQNWSPSWPHSWPLAVPLSLISKLVKLNCPSGYVGHSWLKTQGSLLLEGWHLSPIAGGDLWVMFNNDLTIVPHLLRVILTFSLLAHSQVSPLEIDPISILTTRSRSWWSPQKWSRSKAIH